MSKATTPDQTVKPKRKGNKATPSRKVKDPVDRSEAYVTNTAPSSQSHALKVTEGKKRLNRLRELIEPETESMVKVMIDIAKDDKVHPSIRMECADRVLSRAYGKPKETVVVEDEGSENSEGEIFGLLNNILEAVGAPKLEAPDDQGSPTS